MPEYMSVLEAVTFCRKHRGHDFGERTIQRACLRWKKHRGMKKLSGIKARKLGRDWQIRGADLSAWIDRKEGRS